MVQKHSYREWILISSLIVLLVGCASIVTNVKNVELPKEITATLSRHNSSSLSSSKTETEEVKSPPESNLPLAWLMSFPNSGTTFTLGLFTSLANYSTGTNYPAESNFVDGPIPVTGHSEEVGPFWEGGAYSQSSLPKNGQVVLVKTHCEGYCVNCPPRAFVQTVWTFHENCRQRSGVAKGLNSNSMTESVERTNRLPINAYSSDAVKKAVHLIRNPFNNIVARFNHEYKKQYDLAENKTLFLQTNKRTAAAFHEWCYDLDKASEQKIKEFPMIPTDITNLIVNTKCGAEFFRYMQWHNLAFQLTYQVHPIPTLIIHYEDYRSDTYQETTESLLDFLEYSRVRNGDNGNWTFDDSKKNYLGFYTPEEKQDIWKLLISMSTPDTKRNIVERYNTNQTNY